MSTCKRCGSALRETARSASGDGVLAELRCPKCRVNFFIERRCLAKRPAKAKKDGRG